MALRPELESRVRAWEAQVDTALTEAADLEASVDALVEDSVDGEAIPEETFDDPSIVQHVADLELSVQRARRESNALQRVAGTYAVSKSRSRGR